MCKRYQSTTLNGDSSAHSVPSSSAHSVPSSSEIACKLVIRTDRKKLDSDEPYALLAYMMYLPSREVSVRVMSGPVWMKTICILLLKW